VKEIIMRLQDLRQGDLFQFKRQGGPIIYEVLDPGLGKYRSVGYYDKGVMKVLSAPTAGGQQASSVKSVRVCRLVEGSELWAHLREGVVS
jgi:hypothetical protein